MAQNSGGYGKNHSFPESAFTFNSLNRKEKKKKDRVREQERQRWGERQESRCLALVPLYPKAMTH